MSEKIEFVNAVGNAEIVKDGDAIKSVTISLEGTLQSYRDKALQSRFTQCKERRIRDAGGRWLEKIVSLGVRSYLVQLQRQCGLAEVRIRLVATISRKRKIRDFKDLVAGFDHMILDPLVKAGILIDDDFGNLNLEVNQVDGAGGLDFLTLVFSPDTTDCRKSVTRQVLEFGWPDPEFRNRNKEVRRKEIKEKLTHAHRT